MSEQLGNLTSYRGRFAPSPTGPLHFGSLISAVASYLQSKTRNGVWLVRIEDIDPPREVPGSSDSILHSLEQHGLHWDETVLYQSKHHERYEAALDALWQQAKLYYCQCSRKMIAEAQQSNDISVYPGTCRNLSLTASINTAIRVVVENDTLVFNDPVQGTFQQNLIKDVGDFVLRRADGLFAYQLAVVVDDAFQQISEVVRGSDLLDNTPRQMLLQQYLSLETPAYVHHPVAINTAGEKLSKQTFAKPVDSTDALANVHKVLDFLGQNPPSVSNFSSLDDLWQWAFQHWNIERIPGKASIVVTD